MKFLFSLFRANNVPGDQWCFHFFWGSSNDWIPQQIALRSFAHQFSSLGVSSHYIWKMKDKGVGMGFWMWAVGCRGVEEWGGGCGGLEQGTKVRFDHRVIRLRITKPSRLFWAHYFVQVFTIVGQLHRPLIGKRGGLFSYFCRHNFIIRRKLCWVLKKTQFLPGDDFYCIDYTFLWWKFIIHSLFINVLFPGIEPTSFRFKMKKKM